MKCSHLDAATAELAALRALLVGRGSHKVVDPSGGPTTVRTADRALERAILLIEGAAEALADIQRPVALPSPEPDKAAPKKRK